MAESHSNFAHRLARSLPDVLAVRKLRNQCCAFMTNDQQTLSVWRQIRWYFTNYRRSLAAGSYRIYLFLDSGKPVGYGALQLREGQLLVTECVAADRRGQGLGKNILDALIQIARREKRPLVAEIWASNQASIALHERAGFRRVESRLHKGAELNVYRWEAERQ
jgi:RimJ/RimL family protein N-acetyltransferase